MRFDAEQEGKMSVKYVKEYIVETRRGFTKPRKWWEGFRSKQTAASNLCSQR